MATSDDKRLIEDYLPIQAISAEASREKSVRKGHISTLHLWWARRPLVACRAAVYGALVPASQFVPNGASDEKKKSLGRANAAKFIERLCQYPGSAEVFKEAQEHILKAHADRLSQETGKTVTVDDIVAGRSSRPKVLDMFAGGGAIPLEALRLGCESHALDLNPVAHVIQLCTLVYPQEFGKPDATSKGSAKDGTWAGLAAEVEHWGNWVLERVKTEIGDLYRPIPNLKGHVEEIAPEKQNVMDFASDAQGRLKSTHDSLTPVAYLWTRTALCKNPACRATVPLVKQTWLCKKKDRYVAMRVVTPKGKKQVNFEIVEAATEAGLGFDPENFSKGGNTACPFCGSVVDSEYVRAEGVAKRIGIQLMAVVANNFGPGLRKTFYLNADQLGSALPDEAALRNRTKETCTRAGISIPDEAIEANPRSMDTQHFGLDTWADIFTPRQLLCLLTLTAVQRSCLTELRRRSYSERQITAVGTYLALALDRLANYSTSLCIWRNNRTCVLPTFSRQSLPMVWDFGEMNPFAGSAGDWAESVEYVRAAIESCSLLPTGAQVWRGSAMASQFEDGSFDAVVTDPPYYDNVSYSNLSDFFYIWLKRTVGDRYAEHFASPATPKRSEIISAFYRHDGDRNAARSFYEESMTKAFAEANRILKPGGSLTVVYAHKTTLGWATLVEALRVAGFQVTEAWPIETEMTGGMRTDIASLASSIFIFSRKRSGTTIGSYEDVVRPELEQIVRERVETLWLMGITGADLIIAAVGAGLRAFTRFARVEYANGEEVPAERFLGEVESVVLETLLEKIFGVARAGVSAVDGPSRFYVLWRYAYKAAELDAGEAIVFTYGQPVELDGGDGLANGVLALVEKKKSKYRLRDFTERGSQDRLGKQNDDGKPASLIDALHRLLWLIENDPRKIAEFLDEARPDRERLRLVAQALAGAGLSGGAEDQVTVLNTTASEQTALNKLLANWRSLVPETLFTGTRR